MIAAIRRRLAAESGFTLIELLVTVSIGLVVLIGLMNLIDATGRANARLTDRAETSQRVRTGVERIGRVLRTQACLNISTPPLITGTNNSVSFYSDTPTDAQVNAGQDDTGIIYKPKKVTLTYDATAGGSVTQETWTPAAGKEPGDYTGATYSKRFLIEKVEPQGTTPIFRYYNFSNVNSAVTAPLDDNLATDPSLANSVKRIVKIDVALRGRPMSGNTDPVRFTNAETTVLTRNADLSGGADPNRQWGPRCG